MIHMRYFFLFQICKKNLSKACIFKKNWINYLLKLWLSKFINYLKKFIYKLSPKVLFIKKESNNYIFVISISNILSNELIDKKNIK